MFFLGGLVSVICCGFEVSIIFFSCNLVVEFEILWYFRVMIFFCVFVLDEFYVGVFVLFYFLFNDIVWWF